MKKEDKREKKEEEEKRKKSEKGDRPTFSIGLKDS